MLTLESTAIALLGAALGIPLGAGVLAALWPSGELPGSTSCGH